MDYFTDYFPMFDIGLIFLWAVLAVAVARWHDSKTFFLWIGVIGTVIVAGHFLLIVSEWKYKFAPVFPNYGPFRDGFEVILFGAPLIATLIIVMFVTTAIMRKKVEILQFAFLVVTVLIQIKVWIFYLNGMAQV